MTILYNCKSEGASFRITKFDDDLNPVSSYLTDGRTCDCPAGSRPMCRHREMLPRFQHRGAVDTGWMFDYDRGGWVQMGEAEPVTTVQPHTVAAEYNDSDTIVVTTKPAWRRF